MAFLSISFCTRPDFSSQLSNAKVLENKEKIALITDLVLSILLITAGVLVVLQAQGIANLGQLSAIGIIGAKSGFVMFGLGVGLIAIDLMNLMIQQGLRFNHLLEIAKKEKKRADNLHSECENLKKQLNTNSSPPSPVVNQNPSGQHSDGIPPPPSPPTSNSQNPTIQQPKNSSPAAPLSPPVVNQSSSDQHSDEIPPPPPTSNSQNSTIQQPQNSSPAAPLSSPVVNQNPSGQHSDEIPPPLPTSNSQKPAIQQPQDFNPPVPTPSPVVNQNSSDLPYSSSLPTDLLAQIRENGRKNSRTPKAISPIKKLFETPETESPEKPDEIKPVPPPALANMPMGRSKIRRALSGFKAYLTKKETALTQPQEITQLFVSTSQEIENLFLTDTDIPPSADLEASWIPIVEQDIDLGELDSTLESYFDKLYYWIKEPSLPREQQERVKEALQTLTKDLISVANQSKTAATNQTRKRKTEMVNRESDIKKSEKDEQVKKLKVRVENCIKMKVVENVVTSLLNLVSFSKLGSLKMQVFLSLNNKLKSDNADSAAKQLDQLKNEITESYLHLSDKNLTEDDRKDVDSLVGKAKKLKGYINTLLDAKISHKKIFSEKL